MDETLENPVQSGAEGATRQMPPISQAKGQSSFKNTLCFCIVRTALAVLIFLQKY
jgi:hypothetical protein